LFIMVFQVQLKFRQLATKWQTSFVDQPKDQSTRSFINNLNTSSTITGQKIPAINSRKHSKGRGMCSFFSCQKKAVNK
jgi:hypothetical protein